MIVVESLLNQFESSSWTTLIVENELPPHHVLSKVNLAISGLSIRSSIDRSSVATSPGAAIARCLVFDKADAAEPVATAGHFSATFHLAD